MNEAGWIIALESSRDVNNRVLCEWIKRASWELPFCHGCAISLKFFLLFLSVTKSLRSFTEKLNFFFVCCFAILCTFRRFIALFVFLSFRVWFATAFFSINKIEECGYVRLNVCGGRNWKPARSTKSRLTKCNSSSSPMSSDAALRCFILELLDWIV